MNMTLTFWLIAASLGLVSAGLSDSTQPDRGYGYGDGLSKWSKTLSKEGPKLNFKFESAALV
jgi:hypothetical protein